MKRSALIPNALGAVACSIALGAIACSGAVACSSGFEIRTVDVVFAGPGEGRVHSAGVELVDCPELCRGRVEVGTTLRLVATPESRSTFAGWSGACSGLKDCVVTAEEATIVTARFDKSGGLLTLTRTGTGAGSLQSRPGTIECGPSCEQFFEFGTRVELFATAEPGSLFVGWSGACSGTAPCGVTMTGDRAVSAHFERDEASLDAATIGDGTGTIVSNPPGIDCGSDCSQSYVRNTSVTLVAATTNDSIFTGWSGACSGVGDCRVTLDTSKSVQATFVAPAVSVAVARAGGGAGSVVSSPPGIDCGSTCSAVYAKGALLRLTARSEEGSRFAGWAGACAGSAVCILQLSEATSVIANFVPLSHSLTVAREGRGEGSVASTPGGISCGTTCQAQFPRGLRVTLTPIAEPGSQFDGWSDGCVGDGTCSPTIDRDTAVKARFSRRRHLLSVGMVGHGAGAVRSTPLGVQCPGACDASFDFGTIVSLTATPIAGSDFIGWSGACTGVGACSVTMDGSQSVSARFSGRYVTVAADTFTMGSTLSEPGRSINEGPTRSVTISRDFAMKETEVTQGEWSQVMGTNPSTYLACGPACPVDSVSWNDAIAFVNALSALDGLAPCYTGGPGTWALASTACDGYRLPTEAEWEMAARGGTTTAFAGGGIDNAANDCVPDPTLDRLGWYCGNSPATTHAVATRAANAFGLFDMHGNVAELVHDRFGATYYAGGATIDPTGPTTGSQRVLRGGAYDNFARLCRSAARAAISVASGRPSVGLRPVRGP